LKAEKELLVGDNPFHSISHLSQERIRARENDLMKPEYAADLVSTSVSNGANGFMFSVSDQTLSILKLLREKGGIEDLSLYPIVPYAYEYVKLATRGGGIPWVVKRFAGQIAFSGNVNALVNGIRGIAWADPVSLMKTYLAYEIGRIMSAAGKKANLRSVVLHEIMTDMALALNLDWFFKAYIIFVARKGLVPGFNTVNFSYLINKLKDWNIDPSSLLIVAPFNKVGFQMNPTKTDCEKALQFLKGPTLVAISVLAAGYLRPDEAVEYIAGLPNLRGIAVGVSKEKHAMQTFQLLDRTLNKDL
jgi:hypothetical protein